MLYPFRSVLSPNSSSLHSLAGTIHYERIAGITRGLLRLLTNSKGSEKRRKTI